MLPVSPNEPKERTTGATDEQIEAAVDRETAVYMARYPDASESQIRDSFRFIVLGYAQPLVPPGMVIAPEADVLTSEQRAAIGRMLAWADAESADAYEIEEQTLNDMTILRAIADGGAK